MIEKLKQIKLNAIVARILHNKIKGYLVVCKNIFTIITISLPTIVTAVMYFGKGTEYQASTEILSFIMSISMIICSIIYLTLNVDEKLYQNRLYASKNIDVANEIDKLLAQQEISEDLFNWFNRYVSEVDEKDNEILSGINDKHKRNAYRNALKEFEPGNYTIKCPICDKSPWKYIPGNCQLCGNTKE